MAFPTGSPGTTANYQIEFNGLVMGPGTPYQFGSTVDGLDLPALRTGDVPRSFDLGELMGQDFLGGRDVTFALDVPVANLAALAAATVPQSVAQEFTLWVQGPMISTPVGVAARVRKRAIPWDIRYTAGQLATATLMLHATDPRLYQATATSPLTWGTSVPVTNSGNIEHRPKVTLVGPLITPSITNYTLPGAPFLSFATLTAGQTLVVDLLTHLLTLNGTASPQTQLATGTSWWWVQPGSNSIGFTSGDASQPAGSSATITYSPASWSSAT